MEIRCQGWSEIPLPGFAVEMSYQTRAVDASIKDDKVEGRLSKMHDMELLYMVVCVVDIYKEVVKLNTKYNRTEPLLCEVVCDVQNLLLVLSMYQDTNATDHEKCGKEEKLFWRRLKLVDKCEMPPSAEIRTSRSAIFEDPFGSEK